MTIARKFEINHITCDLTNFLMHAHFKMSFARNFLFYSSKIQKKSSNYRRYITKTCANGSKFTVMTMKNTYKNN